MPFLQSFALNQVVPSVFDAAASLLLVFIFLYIFRIEDPRTKFWLYFLILMRAFLVLIDNACIKMSLTQKAMPFMFGVRLADPFNFLSIDDIGVVKIIYSNDALMITIIVAICGIAAFIVARWMQLLIFLFRLKHEPEINQVENAWLYEIIDTIASSLNSKRPRIVQTDRFPIVPFTIGNKNPTIVMSQELIDRFSREQLEMMLAHEMAHIRRGDYINNWVMMLLRDVMFFNPIARLIYQKAEEEKEKICDREILRIVNTTPKKIASLLVDVALFYKTEQLKTSHVSPSLTKGFLYRKSTLDRRIASILDAPEKASFNQTSSIFKTGIKLVVYLIVLLFQIALMININGTWIVLR